MTALTVYAVFADLAEAQRIGREMVEARLAACVNIMGPCRSIYRWEGAIESSTEVPAIFKTSADKADELIIRIGELHSYSEPAVVAWAIERLPSSFGDWIEGSVR